MKFLIIKTDLLSVFGEKSRGDFEELGLQISPIYQFNVDNKIITLALVINEAVALNYFDHPMIEVKEGIDQFNAIIDELYIEKFILRDSTALQLDIQLSGSVEGYRKELPLTSQENLKLLFNAGMAGISKSQKPPYLQ